MPLVALKVVWTENPPSTQTSLLAAMAHLGNDTGGAGTRCAEKGVVSVCTNDHANGSQNATATSMR